MRFRSRWNRQGVCLVRAGHGEPRLNVRVCCPREIDGLLIACRTRKFGETINRETIAINARRAVEQRLAGFIETEIPLPLVVTTGLFDEIENVRSRVDVFLFLFNFIVERRKCPNRAQLRPDVLVAAEHLALIRNARADTATVRVPINAVLQPKRDRPVEQFGTVQFVE